MWPLKWYVCNTELSFNLKFLQSYIYWLAFHFIIAICDILFGEVLTTTIKYLFWRALHKSGSGLNEYSFNCKPASIARSNCTIARDNCKLHRVGWLIPSVLVLRWHKLPQHRNLSASMWSFILLPSHIVTFAQSDLCRRATWSLHPFCTCPAGRWRRRQQFLLAREILNTITIIQYNPFCLRSSWRGSWSLSSSVPVRWGLTGAVQALTWLVWILFLSL